MQGANSLHIKPIAAFGADDAYEHMLTGWTAQHRSHVAHVGGGCANSVGGAAMCTCTLGERHFKQKHFTQDASCAVAIESPLIHPVSPVLPKRSVLMRVGSYPSASRFAAVVSTNCVGPQMKVRGCCSIGQATTRRSSASMRLL